jgi:hypothetical protein
MTNQYRPTSICYICSSALFNVVKKGPEGLKSPLDGATRRK